MIVLASSRLLARVDPAHGGEILELVDLVTGRQLLGHPPFASLPPLPGALDEESWTDRYRGGWQTVTPNAGNACRVDGELHGFHGRASNDPWTVLESSPDAARLHWSGHGLDVTRALRVHDRTLEVETDWVGTRDRAALISVEHVVVGTELLVPSATVRLPGGLGYELSERDGPVAPPAGAPSWPELLLQDGGVELADTVSPAESNGRFFVVASLPEGWYDVENDATGQGLRIEWDVSVLPHLWIWRELNFSGGRWRRHAELLGLEPASVPHSLGLARARAEGQAIELARDERFHSVVRATPFG